MKVPCPHLGARHDNCKTREHPIQPHHPLGGLMCIHWLPCDISSHVELGMTCRLLIVFLTTPGPGIGSMQRIVAKIRTYRDPETRIVDPELDREWFPVRLRKKIARKCRLVATHVPHAYLAHFLFQRSKTTRMRQAG